MRVVELSEMNSKDNRRLHLLHIVATRFGGRAGQCADFLGMKRSQMSRWLTENEEARQGIAEESARAIELKLGLPPGSMDADMRSAKSGADTIIEDFSRVYLNSTDEGRAFLRGAIAAAESAFMVPAQRTGAKQKHA